MFQSVFNNSEPHDQRIEFLIRNGDAIIGNHKYSLNILINYINLLTVKYKLLTNTV